MTKKNKVILLLIFLLCLSISFPWLAKQVAIDKCLDASGRWNYELKTCEYAV
jgi:hypothetical protein